MTCCPTCLQPLGKRVMRGGLLVSLKPLGVYWKGEAIAATPVQTRLLALLVELGELEHDSIMAACLGHDTQDNTLKVHVCQLRKHLPPEVKITSIHGWGYRLNVEEEVA